MLDPKLVIQYPDETLAQLRERYSHLRDESDDLLRSLLADAENKLPVAFQVDGACWWRAVFLQVAHEVGSEAIQQTYSAGNAIAASKGRQSLPGLPPVARNWELTSYGLELMEMFKESAIGVGPVTGNTFSDSCWRT